MNKVVQRRENNNKVCIGTHNGIFHCDDALAVAMMAIYAKNIEVIRSRNINILKQTDLVLDVGNKTYDHHQQGGNGVRENGVKYASAGLIWRDFGAMIVERVIEEANIRLTDEEISKIVDDIDICVIQEVDKQDNGEKPFNHQFRFVDSFLPNWNNKKESFDKSFEECVDVLEKIFKQVILQKARMDSCPIVFMESIMSPDSSNKAFNGNDILSEVIFSLINEEYSKNGKSAKKYPQAMLAWGTYGKDIVRSLTEETLTAKEMKMVLDYVGQNIFLAANDIISDGIFENLFQFISAYKLDYKDEMEFHSKLNECLSVTKQVLRKVISKGISICLAPKEASIRLANPETHIGNILIIPAQTFTWLDYMVNYNDNSNSPIDFVVFPYPDGGYALQCVPLSIKDSFSKRIPLPEDWAGLSGSDLQKVSGVASATFCHNGRFFARTNELNDAITMCQIATKGYGEKGSGIGY